MRGRPGVPEVVIAVASAMEELLDLRAENRKLRFEKYVPNADLNRLIEDTPFALVHELHGGWSCRITLGRDFFTSVDGDSAEEAFRRALRHVETCWEQREARHREDFGVDEDA